MYIFVMMYIYINIYIIKENWGVVNMYTKAKPGVVFPSLKRNELDQVLFSFFFIKPPVRVG